MGPLRLVILAILIYIGYRLLVGSFSKNNGSKKAGDESVDTNAKITDVLVEDPVCHKLVPQKQAMSLEKDGETYYFCSEKCCKQFASEKGEDE